MALIKSVSGIRGTIGGNIGDNLTPIDIVENTAAFALWIKSTGRSPKVVIGRDGRLSGEVVSDLAVAALRSCGIDVIDLGLSTTPTVEMYVPKVAAGGGIILTASHNPREWNALKLLNHKGEFLSAADGEELKSIIASGLAFATVDELGRLERKFDGFDHHVDAILDLDLVNAESIREADFRVLIDCINSTGSLAFPVLLERLGVRYELINTSPMGEFAHNPEPLERNLQETMALSRKGAFDLTIVVDPDVDRLALLDENGNMIGEEYTLVAAADYVLSRRASDTVSNMSSSRALRDVTEKYGGKHHASMVGEAHVVAKMKEVGAVIGGEGNGGVILPELHAGRDALVGTALILSYMAEANQSLSQIRSKYTTYYMAKLKCNYPKGLDIDALLQEIEEENRQEQINTADGLKIDFADYWVHMRRSNTEPIIRIYSEATKPEEASYIAEKFKTIIETKIQAR